MTFIAALSHDRIDAPMVLDRPINGEWFQAWVEQALIPTLTPSGVVVLDNLGSHKGKAVTASARQGAKTTSAMPDMHQTETETLQQTFKLNG